MLTRFATSRLATTTTTTTAVVLYTPVAFASTKAARAKSTTPNTTPKNKSSWSTIAGKTASLSKAEINFFQARKRYLEAEQAVADANKEVQTARRRVTFIQALVDALSKK